MPPLRPSAVDAAILAAILLIGLPLVVAGLVCLLGLH
jgi:hypothetical protein